MLSLIGPRDHGRSAKARYDVAFVDLARRNEAGGWVGGWGALVAVQARRIEDACEAMRGVGSYVVACSWGRGGGGGGFGFDQ